LEFETIQPRAIDTTFTTPETTWRLHQASQCDNNSDYFAASRAGRSDSCSNVLPGLDLIGMGNDQMSVEGKSALKEDSYRHANNLQQQASDQLQQLWNNREGAPNGDARTRARLESQLANTLQRASGSGVAIELRMPDPVYPNSADSYLSK